MIQEVSGDILLTKAQVIAHGIAPGDPFAQGLALALRERWPAMVKDFRHWCHQAHPKPGTIWIWSGPGLRIVNMLTQEGAYEHGKKPGRAHPEWVNHCLRDLHKEATQQQFTSLALPRLASGVGGLDWQVVHPMIVQHLGSLSIPVCIYTTYQKGIAADEKLSASAHRPG